MRMRGFVGIALLAFIFAFAGVVLFGLFGQGTDAPSRAAFSIGCFALFLVIFGTVYIANAHRLEGALQHALMVLAALILCVGLTMAAVNVKDSYLSTQGLFATQQATANEVAQLRNKNINDQDLLSSLSAQLAQVQQHNVILQGQIASLQANITATQQAQVALAVKQAQAALAAQQLAAQQAQAALIAQQQAQAALIAQQQAQAALAAQQAAQQQASQTRRDGGQGDD